MWFSILLNIILVPWCAFTTFYLVRFIKYLMIKEDILSSAIEVLNRTLGSFTYLLSLPLFYDSKEIKEKTTELLEDIKLSKVAVQRVADDFTRLSKGKYVTLESETDDESLE